MILLNESEIRQHLRDPNIEITLLENTTSTNDYFKDCAPSSYLQACFAEHQNAGRGRFHRAWIAPFGANILMSCRVGLPKKIQNLGALSLCVGLALLKSLETLGVQKLNCKWPNDLMYQNQKLAGILIETQTQGANKNITDVIIGMGLNVNMSTETLASIERPTTSLQVILGKAQNRNQIAAHLLNTLLDHIKLFQEQGFEAFQTDWNLYDMLRDKEITLNVGNSHIIGKSIGVDATGQLLLQLPSGEVRAYSSGEASLCKDRF